MTKKHSKLASAINIVLEILPTITFSIAVFFATYMLFAILLNLIFQSDIFHLNIFTNAMGKDSV